LQKQFLITNNNTSFAPGFCRSYRDKLRPSKEVKPEYSLIVMHDHNGSIQQLEENIVSHNDCKQIIICDMTYKNDRQSTIDMLALQRRLQKINTGRAILIHFVNDKDAKIHNIVRELCSIVITDYFVIMSSDTKLSSQANTKICNQLQRTDLRFMYWKFPVIIQQTSVYMSNFICGLYLRDAFRKIHDFYKEDFWNVIDREEIQSENGIKLIGYLDIYHE